MSVIKNRTIEEKLRNATESDSVMQDFLLAIVSNEYKTTQYNKVYNAEINKAVRQMKESDD